MTQPTIVIYTATYCPYCTRAKMLLDSKGLTYKEIDVTDDPAGREALVEKAEGRRTVPQIFINDQPMGGFDDLAAKNQSGDLDQLIGR
jgi:glutaredoxin 3